MKRILLFNDSHLSEKQPASRIDPIIEVNEDKFYRMANIYNDYKCSLTICGGDLLNSYIPDTHSLKIVSDYIRRTGDFYLLPGNHDLPPGGNPYQFEETILSVFIEVSDKMRVLSKSIFVEDVEIKPIHFSRQFGNIFVFPNTKKDVLFIITHLLIGKDGKWTNIEDIITNAELFLLAHTHEQLEEKVGDTLFFNSGALIRRRYTDRDIIPQVGILEIDGKKWNLKTVKLGSPQPNFSKAKRETVGKIDFSELVRDSMNIKEDFDVKCVLKTAIDKTKGISKDTETLINTIIEEAKSE